MLPNNTRILPNFFQPDIWSSGYDTSLTSKSDEAIFFGKFTKQKNLDSLIRAAARERLRLILIGDGAERSNLQELARAENVDVEFPGRLAQPAIRRYLARARFFVLPSNYEGQPKALIEAMAFGIPVLVTNAIGIKSEVVDGQTGVVVENSIDGLRSGIRKFLQMTDSDRNRLAQNAKKRVLSKFSLSTVAAAERLQFQELVWSDCASHSKS